MCEGTATSLLTKVMFHTCMCFAFKEFTIPSLYINIQAGNQMYSR